MAFSVICFSLSRIFYDLKIFHFSKIFYLTHKIIHRIFRDVGLLVGGASYPNIY